MIGWYLLTVALVGLAFASGWFVAARAFTRAAQAPWTRCYSVEMADNCLIQSIRVEREELLFTPLPLAVGGVRNFFGRWGRELDLLRPVGVKARQRVYVEVRGTRGLGDVVEMAEVRSDA